MIKKLSLLLKQVKFYHLNDELFSRYLHYFLIACIMFSLLTSSLGCLTLDC